MNFFVRGNFSLGLCEKHAPHISCWYGLTFLQSPDFSTIIEIAFHVLATSLASAPTGHIVTYLKTTG